jgi:hypothetical protein
MDHDEDEITPEHIEWCLQILRVIEDGGWWAIPRTGIVLQKHDKTFLLVGQMREQDRKRMQATPNDVEHRFEKHGINKLKVNRRKFLSQEQRLEYHGLRLVFERAGITLKDATGEMPYVIQEHSTITYGITKMVHGRNVNQQLGMTFDLEEAMRKLCMYGFDLANMTLLQGTRPLRGVA